jgi:hypothetical protein
MTDLIHPDNAVVPDAELWDLPDHLSWEECLEETAFPARHSDHPTDEEQDR